MTPPLALMLIGAGFQTHLWASTKFVILVNRVTLSVTCMATIKAVSADPITASQWELLEITPISYLIATVVSLANQW